MSNLSDLPQHVTTDGTPRKISANKYATCPCGVRCYEGEQMYAEWCYREDCPCTDKRWPTDWHVNRLGIDCKTLNRPGWEPGVGRPTRVKGAA